MHPDTPEAIREFYATVEEAHRRWGSITLSEVELVILLTNLAAINACAAEQGVLDPVIAAVENYVWWDLSNALSRDNRVMMHGAMKDAGIPLPPHPGDFMEKR